jgi:hypothetical protein
MEGAVGEILFHSIFRTLRRCPYHFTDAAVEIASRIQTPGLSGHTAIVKWYFQIIPHVYSVNSEYK